MIETINPDIICMEDEKNSLGILNTYREMLELMHKYDGDIQALIKNEEKQTLKRCMMIDDEDEEQ